MYREIVLVDFEFVAHPGERPEPVCLVAKLLRSGRTIRLWRDQFDSTPPYPIDADTLFVAYYASAELGCHKALGWPMPARILDLFTEFRDHTNMGSWVDQGRRTPSGAGLLGALTYFGLDAMGATEKTEMRDLIMRGGPWTIEERIAILNYCEGDVTALERLLSVMLPQIDLPRALFRGRYMAAAAAMEHTGIPIDVPTLRLLQEHWTGIQDDLIRAIDVHGIYDGRAFKLERWGKLMAALGIPWAMLESGQLDLGDRTFRQMAKSYPVVSPYRDLRSSLSDMRLNDLAVGKDGRNRTILSAFRSRTGRNQPGNSKYIFGPSVWLRGLIKPPPGYGIAYVDWTQQEFGEAAALSGDTNMREAYRSGDPYLAFAKQAGAVPADATKATHKNERELYKACVLGVQYGMEAESLALRIGQPQIVARDLLRAHRETYRTFWSWSDAVVDHAMLFGSIHTVFGWHVHIGENSNPRSLRNFLMQANGAEMLRLACCLATERGIEVCGPVHDAVLICAPLDRLDEDVARMREVMAEASRIVLGGFELGTDCPDEFDEHGKPVKYPHIIRYPHRFMDERGAVMWDRVMDLIAKRRAVPARELVA